MEQKRNKLWRRQHTCRVFKARMILFAAYGHPILDEDGQHVQHPRWFELAKQPWCRHYKTSGSPCSCWICQGERYNRLEYKKTTQRILCETQDW